jgi:sulfate permease, SulP family
MSPDPQAEDPAKSKERVSYPVLLRILPFLGWFEDLSRVKLRADLLAGLTVAMVLIPQSMAYAQLAGLPVYYGLYASFLPPMVGALFGSSRQLATGPVAVVSLMTAAALEPLAVAGSEAYCAYAILLAVLVGLFQLSLGVLRLGLVVKLISHPVVNGFTTAAAIIIATSQLSKIFGVQVDKAEHHYETIIRVCEAALSRTHWPTLAFAVGAFAVMAGFKRLNPRIPNVLVAVAAATVISWGAGFENDRGIAIGDIRAEEVVSALQAFNADVSGLEKVAEERMAARARATESEEKLGERSVEAAGLRHELGLVSLRMEDLKDDITLTRKKLRAVALQAGRTADGATSYFMRGSVPDGIEQEPGTWRIKVGSARLDFTELRISGGGAVVGAIPAGLPPFSVPKLDLSAMLQLLSMSMIISLLGFMEAISIAKAMAARTGQRLDPNQELIGQGLANLLGSAGNSYPVSGSFSRSAVNLQAGAETGFSSVFSAITVLVTLLFLTPLLFHLPQAVLAAIIMMAVVGLINARGFVHAFKAQRHDGVISVITFVATLGFAPHLDRGILIGVGLSLVHYLLRNMKPRIAFLSKHSDGTFRDAKRWGLGQCEHVSLIRFHGSLFFASADYLEEVVLERLACSPKLRHVLIVGNGINELDASGEELLSLLVTRLRSRGFEISFSGLNDSTIDVMKRTHLYDSIGAHNFFRNASLALATIHAAAHRRSSEEHCPLLETRLLAPAGEQGDLEAENMRDGETPC